MDVGDIYHSTNEVQTSFASDCLEKAKKRINQKIGDRKCKLLDVGTGDGRVLSEVLLKKSGLNIEKVVAIDINDDMIAFAEKNYQNDLITYTVQDIEDEEGFPKFVNEDNDDGFDIVTSYFCLHWIKDIDAALRNIHKSLKMGGIFHFGHLVVSPFSDVLTTMAHDSKYSEFKNDILKCFFVTHFESEQFERSLKEAGFTMDFCEMRAMVHDYESAENAKKSFSVLPFLKAMSEEMRVEFMDDFIERMKPENRQLGLNDYENQGIVLHCLVTKN